MFLAADLFVVTPPVLWAVILRFSSVQSSPVLRGSVLHVLHLVAGLVLEGGLFVDGCVCCGEWDQIQACTVTGVSPVFIYTFMGLFSGFPPSLCSVQCFWVP